MSQTLQGIVTLLTIIGMSFGAFFFFEGRYSKSDETNAIKQRLDSLAREFKKTDSLAVQLKKNLKSFASIKEPVLIEYGNRTQLSDGTITDDIRQRIELENRSAIFISAYASATQKIDDREVDEKYAKVEVKVTLDGKEVAREHSGIIRGMKKVEIAASAAYVAVLNVGTHQVRATGVYQGVVLAPNPTVKLSYVIVEENHPE